MNNLVGNKSISPYLTFLPCFKCGAVALRFAAKLIDPFELIGGGGPILGDLWALKGLIEEGQCMVTFYFVFL